MNPTQESLNITRFISDNINNQTMHHIFGARPNILTEGNDFIIHKI